MKVTPGFPLAIFRNGVRVYEARDDQSVFQYARYFSDRGETRVYREVTLIAVFRRRDDG